MRVRGLAGGTGLVKPSMRTGRWCKAGCLSPRARISPKWQPRQLCRRTLNFRARRASPRSSKGFGSGRLAWRRLVERGELPGPGGAAGFTRSRPAAALLPVSAPPFSPFAAGGVCFTQPLPSCDEPIATETPPAPRVVPPATHTGRLEGGGAPPRCRHGPVPAQISPSRNLPRPPAV